jgi:hypothetical protein
MIDSEVEYWLYNKSNTIIRKLCFSTIRLMCCFCYLVDYGPSYNGLKECVCLTLGKALLYHTPSQLTQVILRDRSVSVDVRGMTCASWDGTISRESTIALDVIIRAIDFFWSILTSDSLTNHTNPPHDMPIH